MTSHAVKLDQNFVNGRWTDPVSSGRITVVNPASEQPIGEVADSVAEDVEVAVDAARAASGSWAATNPEDRAAYLIRAHEHLRKRAAEFVDAIVEDVGTPAKIAQRLQVDLPSAVLESYTDPGILPADHTIGNSLITREPIGVVGAITPWNYPLHQSIAKVAPALLAGCTVVIKPSEVTPLAVHLLAEVLENAELPGGVFNLIHGGATAGAALVDNPGVDMVSFTGSTRAGRQVAAAASRDVKRVALELGGKSPNIVLPDIEDLARVVKNAVGNCFLNSGQTCLALTRLLVHRDRYDEAVELAGGFAETFRPGDPRDPATRLGPMTSGSHRERVRDYIRSGIEEGARLVTGGPDAPEGLDTGYFVRPTVFADVRSSMRIAREEIFGPVLCVLPYDTEEEAVAIANSTPYGLTAAVWSADPDRALRVARGVRSGQVDINGAAFNPLAPFGGYKQSGNGRELGPFGLDEFLEVKSIQR